MSDPYVYPGTSVLRNKFDLRDADASEEVERRIVLAALYKLRMKSLKMPISIARLKATHKAIFGEIYPWAGEFRENTGSMRKWREAAYAVV